MNNLRDFVDGVSSLAHDLIPGRVDTSFKVQQEVVARRQTNRSGPVTNEIKVGTILALGDKTATVSFRTSTGGTEKREMRLSDLSQVTTAFKRQSIQFQPAFRGRV